MRGSTVKSAVSRAFDRALEVAAENIGYRARIDRKVNEAIWAKLETLVDRGQLQQRGAARSNMRRVSGSDRLKFCSGAAPI